MKRSGPRSQMASRTRSSWVWIAMVMSEGSWVATHCNGHWGGKSDSHWLTSWWWLGHLVEPLMSWILHVQCAGDFHVDQLCRKQCSNADRIPVIREHLSSTCHLMMSSPAFLGALRLMQRTMELIIFGSQSWIAPSSCFSEMVAAKPMVLGGHQAFQSGAISQANDRLLFSWTTGPLGYTTGDNSQPFSTVLAGYQSCIAIIYCHSQLWNHWQAYRDELLQHS